MLSETKNDNPKSLDQWVRVLCEQEMPIFSNTAQNIYSTLDDKKKGAMELSSIILQDPNLTTKLLKVSNSSYYNPSNQKMSTISRAIVILGSRVIRELTVACSFFEAIISPENKQRANREIGQAIHAAVQAKEIAITCNDRSPEEVFIAALLNNIGSIAFWCFGGKQCKYITELIQSGNFSPEQAENKVLGFSLDELGKCLSTSWQLGGLIEETILNPSSPNSRVQIVQLGKEITHAIDEGWDSSQLKDCLKKLESFSGESQTQIKLNLKKNSASAVKIACKFGALDASKFIQSDTVHNTEFLSAADKPLDPKQIQFNILQDITSHISGSININLLLEMVVEGIHRGIGMDRTLFSLLSSDKKTLVEKLSLGWQKDLNAEKIKLDVSGLAINLFFKALQSPDGMWANPDTDNSYFTPQIINRIGKTECFLIPIHTKQKIIGLIYADRSINNKPLTEDDFKTAKHFTQQAIIGLALYKKRTDK